jgi:hypothetical protein
MIRYAKESKRMSSEKIGDRGMGADGKCERKKKKRKRGARRELQTYRDLSGVPDSLGGNQ